MDSKTRVFLALIYVVVAAAQPPTISPAADDTVSTLPAPAPASPASLQIWKLKPPSTPKPLYPDFPISLAPPWVFSSPPAPELPSPPPASVSLTFTPTYHQSGAEKLMRNMLACLTMGVVIFGCLLL